MNVTKKVTKQIKSDYYRRLGEALADVFQGRYWARLVRSERRDEPRTFEELTHPLGEMFEGSVYNRYAFENHNDPLVQSLPANVAPRMERTDETFK